jgi:cytochrome b involved in lipid metabolism
MDIADNEVILEGVVYNLCEFSKVHPGGSNILNIFIADNYIYIFIFYLKKKLSDSTLILR